MSERTTRLLSVIALSLAAVALAVAFLALERADDRTHELERLRSALERAAVARPGTGSGPPLGLDPRDD